MFLKFKLSNGRTVGFGIKNCWFCYQHTSDNKVWDQCHLTVLNRRPAYHDSNINVKQNLISYFMIFSF